MTPTQSVLHERSKRFHAEIARKAAALEPEAALRAMTFVRPKMVVIDPEPFYKNMWFYHLVTEPVVRSGPARVEDIQRAVCRRFDVSRLDMLSDRRTWDIVKPRQVAMYLSKELTMRSLPEIGRRFGGRDHSTVIHSIRKIESLIGVDMDLTATIALIKADLAA